MDAWRGSSQVGLARSRCREAVSNTHDSQRELPAADSDAYLLRAVIRTAVRSLTIYVSRLEYLILPALTDAAFTAPVNLSATNGPSAGQLNSTQLFSVSLCHAAWETCEVLEIALGNRRVAYPKFVAELLRPVMDKLDSVVARVITPLMANVKRELLTALDSSGHTPPGPAKALPVPGTATPAGSAVNAKALHTMPPCLKNFASKVEGARKVFELVCRDCREDGESWITSVVVAVIWRGMVVCQTKYALQGDLPARDANGRPPSPESMAKAMAALAVEPAVPKPAAGPVSAVGKMASILPSRPVSRPSSPPRTSGDFGKGPSLEPTAQHLAAFENLVQRLVNGLVLPPVAGVTDPDATENLAREAHSEAIEALQSQHTVVMALQSGPAFICEVLKNLRDDVAMPTEAEENILDAAEDVPAVLLFHLLARRVNIAIAKYVTVTKQTSAGGSAFLKSPYEVWGISRLDYDRQVMSGFGVAEERARRVALAWKGELERALPEVTALASGTAASVTNHNEIAGWLKSLGLALEARTGVKALISA